MPKIRIVATVEGTFSDLIIAEKTENVVTDGLVCMCCNIAN